MKAAKNVLTGLLLATGLIVGLRFLYGQEAATVSATPDSIVQLDR